MWLTGLVAPRHVGSSQTRARTRVPCIGRQTLNHCATREALYVLFYMLFHYGLSLATEYSSLSYTLGPCCLSILNVIVCIYQPQTPSPSLPVCSWSKAPSQGSSHLLGVGGHCLCPKPLGGVYYNAHSHCKEGPGAQGVGPGSCTVKKKEKGASLVAQWLRICLPMQGMRVRALVWEDPTCRRATRPVSHNY